MPPSSSERSHSVPGRVDIGQGEPTWAVLADPQGNEFCILRALTAEELASP